MKAPHTVRFTSEIDPIWIDEPAAFERAQEFLRVVMPRFVNRLKLYEEKVPIFHKYGIEDEIAKIQRRRVDLPEGGSIVIDQTEALVAIGRVAGVGTPPPGATGRAEPVVPRTGGRDSGATWFRLQEPGPGGPARAKRLNLAIRRTRPQLPIGHADGHWSVQ